MSQVLKSEILNTGQLEKTILTAIKKFGGNEYTGSPDPDTQQKDFAKELAEAIADGVAKGVQGYLTKNVTTQPANTLPAPGPVTHPHPILPIKMIAP